MPPCPGPTSHSSTGDAMLEASAVSNNSKRWRAFGNTTTIKSACAGTCGQAEYCCAAIVAKSECTTSERACKLCKAASSASTTNTWRSLSTSSCRHNNAVVFSIYSFPFKKGDYSLLRLNIRNASQSFTLMSLLFCTIRCLININVTWRRQYMLRLILFSLSALLFLLHMAQAQQALTPSAHQAALAQQALSQARAKNFSALEATLRQLGPNPLDAYFDYHKVRNALPHLSVNEVKAYQRKYADNPLTGSIQNVPLLSYGSHQKWRELLALQPQEPSNITAQCYYWRAQYSQQPSKALQAVPKLWLSGESRPNACDPLFDAARKAGVIDADLVWQRIELALDKQSVGLMRHLTSFINGTRAEQSEFAQQVLANPNRVLSMPNHWPEAFKDELKSVAVQKQ